MSIAIMTEVWKTTLPLARKMVLLALADNANDQGECYPSISMIGSKCSLKERAVYDCLKQLEVDGFLMRLSRSGRSSVYRITAPPNWPTPAFNAPLHNMHPFPVDKSPPTPAQYAPITITEPSLNQKRSKAPVDNFSPVADAADENPAALLSVATENLVSNLVALGVKITTHDPLARDWIERGVTAQIARWAVAIARQRKPKGSIPPRYLHPIIEEIMTSPGVSGIQRGPPGWWNNEAGTLAMGQTLGVIPLRGESMPEFRSRIQIEIEKLKKQTQRRA
ncbi:helix-turn-helix domain-containing protein [Ferrovum myxofaciens]|uniref:helix-turn-helix domain-containing protein n=1 Tax=Ferrovum myxofaciens TaxID=416213 RepID=UPI0006900DDA|nr:helix-turn-helix domain-containing protein [Ferrovum myxofaciens]